MDKQEWLKKYYPLPTSNPFALSLLFSYSYSYILTLIFVFRYRVLSPIPNWLHNFHTDFSLNVSNSQQVKPQKQNANNSDSKILKINHKDTSKKRNVVENKKKALHFIQRYIPNKSPYISGEMVNSKMQLYKQGTLISYFTR